MSFILNLFTDGRAFLVVIRGGGADVRKIVVKDHGALVDAQRQHKVGVHHA